MYVTLGNSGPTQSLLKDSTVRKKTISGVFSQRKEVSFQKSEKEPGPFLGDVLFGREVRLVLGRLGG